MSGATDQEVLTCSLELLQQRGWCQHQLMDERGRMNYWRPVTREETMSDLVPTEDIERIVGVDRHATAHFGRAVSTKETVYVLHSHECKDSGIDLRECPFSFALDEGIDQDTWAGYEDRAVELRISGSDEESEEADDTPGDQHS